MARPGIGQFAGNPDDPHDPTRAGVFGFLGSMIADPGIRLAGSRRPYGNRTMTGTALTVQAFVRPQGGSNSAEALDVHANAPLKRNRQRALGQHRGQAWMATTPSL